MSVRSEDAHRKAAPQNHIHFSLVPRTCSDVKYLCIYSFFHPFSTKTHSYRASCWLWTWHFFLTLPSDNNNKIITKYCNFYQSHSDYHSFCCFAVVVHLCPSLSVSLFQPERVTSGRCSVSRFLAVKRKFFIATATKFLLVWELSSFGSL